MNTEMKNLLERWRSLDKDDGLRRADFTARVLWFVGLALFILVAFGVVHGLHPAAVAVAAAAMGWVIAERNALRTRLVQWPIFRRYIDWNRVQKDLSNDDKSDCLAPGVGGGKMQHVRPGDAG